MPAVSITLSDEKQARLESLARKVGLSPEEYLRRRVEQLLDLPDSAFTEAADHVMRKNAELYQRLNQIEN